MYFNIHSHDDFSNSSLGFPDVICKTEELIQKAYDIGLNGIAITNHETVSSHIKALKYFNSMEKNRPFCLALGNECYLQTDEEYLANKEENGNYPFYHFILIALDTEGHKQLRELSTRAWKRAYKKNIWRRPTLYSDLEEIVGKNKGHLIGSSSCLGSRLDRLLIEEDYEGAEKEIQKLLRIFGKKNLYIECQPAYEKETDQWIVNNRLLSVAQKNGLKIIPSTDVHYLEKEDRYIHSIYLKSQNGQRETDDFYATTYLMSPDELRSYLRLNFTDKQIDQMYKWSNEICERVQGYDLFHKPIIPQIPDDRIPKNFYKQDNFKYWYDKYSNFAYYANENLSVHEKYFFYQVEKGLREKVKYTSKGKKIEKYIKRLDEEFEQFRLISEQLNTSIPCYFSSMSKIIDLIWEAGSLAMPARGSAAGCLTNYLLDVTQIDPVPLGEYFPFWRFMSTARGVELPD